jgi:Host cell surface-exposed lipoprotein
LSQQPYGPQYPPQPPFGGPPYPPFGGPPQQPPRRRKKKGRAILLSVIGAAVLVFLVSFIASAASHSTSTTPSADNNPAQPVSTPAAQPSTQAPAEPTTQAPPQMTASQQAAIQAAESYLQTEPGWSYQGLINQLDSSAGSGFSVADATFAVNHLSPTPNWNQQAADAAQNYQSTEGGFSACSMVQQLDSPDGDQFTQAQAEYGAQAIGLGTC